MKVDLENVTSIKKKITVIVPRETVDVEIERAYVDLNKKVKIRGFRPGKIPRDILVRQFKEQVEADVTETIFKDTYPKAISEAGAHPVSYPEVETDGAKTGSDFSYHATFEVMPEIALPDYARLEVEREKVIVEKKDVEKTLENLSERFTTLETEEKTRGIKEGDVAVIDFTTSIDGKGIGNGKTENFTLDVGAKMISEDFDRKITGKKQNEDFEFDIDFPEDHNFERFRAKRVHFRGTVKEIKNKKVPKINDDFAKDVGDFKSLKELEERIGEDLEKRTTARVNDDFRKALLSILIEKNPFEVPQALIQERSFDIIRDTEMRLRGQGLSLESMKIKPEAMLETVRPQAEFDVKSHLILEEIAKKENIVATREEAEERLKKDAEAMGMEFEKLKKTYDDRGAWDDLMGLIRTEKTLDFLTNTVKIKEVKKDKKEG